MYKLLLKKCMFPIIEWYSGTNILRCYKELDKSQWLKPSEIHQLQFKKLCSLLAHAYNNVPYYHRIFRNLELRPEDIKSTKDLVKLPILTKEIIRKNFDKLIAQNHTKLVLTTTGGSVGEPLKFYRDNTTRSYTQASVFRNLNWAGWELGDGWCTLSGSSYDIKEIRKMDKRLYATIIRRKILPADNLSEKQLDNYIDILRRFKPKIITGYASSLFLMAKFMEKERIANINPASIVSGSEMLFPWQRFKIKEQFNCDVFDGYGSREFQIAYECEEHTGYHISAETVLMEFVKNEEQVYSGESGKILITDLHNYAMPLIRYEIGDVGKPSDEQCSCGRGLPLMSSLEGRITDFIVTPSKKVISGTMLSLVFKDFDFVKKYQVIQKTKNKIFVKLVPTKPPSQDDEKNLLTILQKHIGFDVEIEIKFVEAIPTPPSGKYRAVISNVSIEPEE